MKAWRRQGVHKRLAIYIFYRKKESPLYKYIAPKLYHMRAKKENEKVIRVYYDQLLVDSKQVSKELYTLVITIFEDNEWRF